MSETVSAINEEIDLVNHMLLPEHPGDHPYEDDQHHPGVCAACAWVTPNATFQGELLRPKLQEALNEMVQKRRVLAASIRIPLS